MAVVPMPIVRAKADLILMAREAARDDLLAVALLLSSAFGMLSLSFGPVEAGEIMRSVAVEATDAKRH